MSKKYINVSGLEGKELAARQEIVNLDLYNLIDAVEVKKSTTAGVNAKVKPMQFWYDQDADQIKFRRPDGTDKTVG